MVVLSVTNRFSLREVTALGSFLDLFGRKISNYVVVLFTGGDTLEDDETLEDYLGDDCPKFLKVNSICRCHPFPLLLGWGYSSRLAMAVIC